jgi:uncharacterized protein
MALLVIALVLRWTSLAESVTIYQPARSDCPLPTDVEEVWITTPDGVRLHAWFLRALGAAPGEVRPAVLHLHGNAGSNEEHEPFSAFLRKHGMHVLLLDYRGYGKSDPKRLLHRRLLLIDSLAAYDALAARPDVDPTRIGLYGVSLGGSFAAAVARERPQAAALCTVSAFSTWAGIAQDHLPILGPILMPTGLDAKDNVTHLGIRPYLIVHGETDSIVPIRHAHVLKDAAKKAGVDTEVAIITGGDHNAIIADHPDASLAITNFFVRTLHAIPVKARP